MDGAPSSLVSRRFRQRRRYPPRRHFAERALWREEAAAIASGVGRLARFEGFDVPIERKERRNDRRKVEIFRCSTGATPLNEVLD